MIFFDPFDGQLALTPEAFTAAESVLVGTGVASTDGRLVVGGAASGTNYFPAHILAATGSATNVYGLKVDEQTAGTSNFNLWTGPSTFSNDPYGYAQTAKVVYNHEATLTEFAQGGGILSGMISFYNVPVAMSGTNQAIGLYGVASTTGAGARHWIHGFEGDAYHGGSGTLDRAHGVTGYIENTGAGIITIASLLRAETAFISGAGTIGSVYGVSVDPQTAGASNYAIRTDQAAAATSWAYYGGSDAQSYFGGFVGIGATVPASKLDVTTAAIGVTQTDTSGLALINTTAATAGLVQYSPALRWRGFGLKTAGSVNQSHDFRTYVIPVSGGSNSQARLAFDYGFNGAAYSELMTVTGAGRLGLGTTAPSAKLHLVGAAGVDTLTIQGGTAGTNGIIGLISNSLAIKGRIAVIETAGNIVGGSIIGDIAFNITSAQSLVFGINSIQKMRLDANGSVGIGVTTAPAALLELGAGTAAAGTAPFKLNSGAVLTAPVAGVMEFLTDALYFTITTGTARKTVAFLESPTLVTPVIGVASGTSLSLSGKLDLISTGGAPRAGTLTLVLGTATVNTTAATATALIFFQRVTAGGTIGFATTYTTVANTSFTVSSDSALDTSTYNWWIVETH